MITINMEKARVTAHGRRRAARAVEFAPLDEIIAKQIPGNDAAEAEAKRQEIREKYAAIQQEIDGAEDAGCLTEIVKGL